MQSHMPLMIRPKSKPEVKFQYGSDLFQKQEGSVSQLWIEVEKLQI